MIPNVIKGSAPSLVDTALANSVIDAVNSLSMIEIAPQGFGSATVTVGKGGKVIINLSGIREIIAAEIAAKLKTIEGRLNSATVTAACGPDGSILVTLKI